MRKWIKILLGLIAILIIAAGIFALTPMGRDVIKIFNLSGDLQTAKITDTQVYNPQITIGEKCTATPLAAPDAPLDEALTAALAQAQAYSEEQSGVGLIVMKDGALIHESYADGGAADQPTLSYSMHKSLMALAIGIAINDGVLGSLDDPIESYIEEWADEPRGAITLRQLLNMESGLELTGPMTLEGMRLVLGNDINSIALDKELTAEPGTEFTYNNANSQIVGIALDRALKKSGGKGYASFLEQKIWCPAGNNAAALWYDSDPEDGGTPRYYAGVFSNLSNWARIGELIRNQGQVAGAEVVPADWIEAMSEPAPTNPNYGLHVWLDAPEDGKRAYSQSSKVTVPHSAPYLAEDVMFFDGFGGQRVYIVPSAGITIARAGQVNFAYDDAKIVNLVLEALAQ